MTTIPPKLRPILDRINQMSCDTRYRLQPQLRRAIVQCERDGHQVPSKVLSLNEALQEEAVEAQFDNLPV